MKKAKPKSVCDIETAKLELERFAGSVDTPWDPDGYEAGTDSTVDHLLKLIQCGALAVNAEGVGTYRCQRLAPDVLSKPLPLKEVDGEVLIEVNRARAGTAVDGLTLAIATWLGQPPALVIRLKGRDFTNLQALAAFAFTQG